MAKTKEVAVQSRRKLSKLKGEGSIRRERVEKRGQGSSGRKLNADDPVVALFFGGVVLLHIGGAGCLDVFGSISALQEGQCVVQLSKAVKPVQSGDLSGQGLAGGAVGKYDPVSRSDLLPFFIKEAQLNGFLSAFYHLKRGVMEIHPVQGCLTNRARGAAHLCCLIHGKIHTSSCSEMPGPDAFLRNAFRFTAAGILKRRGTQSMCRDKAHPSG